MKLYILLKSKSERGEQRGGKFLRRVVTGRDKDGSPQYRYLRTTEELEAYEKRHKDDKVTHEEQKEEHDKIKHKTEKKKPKTKGKPSLIVKKDKEEKVEKSLYVRL